MLATRDRYDQFTPRIRSRLKIAGMGLGLVRLLVDAGLVEEARTTLCWLQNGFPGMAEAPQTQRRDANRWRGSLRL